MGRRPSHLAQTGTQLAWGSRTRQRWRRPAPCRRRGARTQGRRRKSYRPSSCWTRDAVARTQPPVMKSVMKLNVLMQPLFAHLVRDEAQLLPVTRISTSAGCGTGMAMVTTPTQPKSGAPQPGAADCTARIVAGSAARIAAAPGLQVATPLQRRRRRPPPLQGPALRTVWRTVCGHWVTSRGRQLSKCETDEGGCLARAVAGAGRALSAQANSGGP